MALGLLSSRRQREEMMNTPKRSIQAAGSFRQSFVGIAGMLMMTGTLHAFAGEIAAAGDEKLRRAAEEAVRTDPFLGVFDQVFVEVEGGHLRLSGSVEQACRREAAAARVARLSGVLDVRNDIEVQSSAPADVMLRRRLFERLYYGGVIEASSRPDWPVRILVSDGRVTLAGELTGDVDRDRLEAIAWNSGARFVEVELQLPVNSMQLAAARN